MRVVIAATVIAIYSAITFYIGWNLKAWLQSMHLFRWPAVFWIGLFLISLGFIVGRIHEVFEPLSVLGSYWFFVLQYGLALCILANILVKFTPLSTKLVGTSAVVVFIVLFAFGTYFAYSPVVRELKITIDKPGEDMRVVMASDFHLGVLSNKRHLENFVELSNSAKPDLILLAGDIIDDDPKRFIKTGMGDVMRQLTSTYGVYGVLGNHEYYGGEIPRFKQAMADANVQILMDETVNIADKFYVTGREDRTNKSRGSLETLKPELEKLPWFVMDHTPDDIATPAQLGVDFHVSGHTHKGQMWPNHLITQKIFELDYGHKLKDAMHALVSSGYGFWGPPTRIGSRSELWVVDIKFSNE